MIKNYPRNRQLVVINGIDFIFEVGQNGVGFVQSLIQIRNSSAVESHHSIHNMPTDCEELDKKFVYKCCAENMKAKAEQLKRKQGDCIRRMEAILSQAEEPEL